MLISRLLKSVCIGVSSSSVSLLDASSTSFTDSSSEELVSSLCLL